MVNALPKYVHARHSFRLVCILWAELLVFVGWQPSDVDAKDKRCVTRCSFHMVYLISFCLMSSWYKA